MTRDRLPAAETRGVLSGYSTRTWRSFAGPVYRPPTAVSEPVPYARPVRIPAPKGWKASKVRRTDIVIASDDSGSMYWPGGDPAGVRRAAALSVAGLLAQAKGARMGVVHWGSTAPTELMLTLTDLRHRRRIEAALAIPPSLGGNNFPAALARSRQVLEPSGTDRVGLVVCITDGIEEVGSDTAEQLALLPARSVHVLLVDHSGGCTPDLEARWAALALGSFTRLNLLDTTQMAQQIAAIVAHAADTAPPEPITPPTTRRTPS